MQTDGAIEISVLLSRILNAAAGSLTSIEVDVEYDETDEIYSLMSIIATLFNIIRFHNLRELVLKANESSSYDCWYKDVWSTQTEVFTANLTGLRFLHVEYYSWSHPQQRLMYVQTEFENWIASLPVSRLYLQAGFKDYDPDFALRANAVLASTTIQQLSLFSCTFRDSLSTALENLKPTLTTMVLDFCSLDPDTDRWSVAFDQCFNLSLERLYFWSCSYSDNPYEYKGCYLCGGSRICSPFKEDKEALIPFLEHFGNRGVLNLGPPGADLVADCPHCDYGEQML